MTVYVVTTTTRPTVVCPSWCEATEVEHISALTSWDGYAVHQWHVGLGDTPALEQFCLSAGVTLCADGTPDPDTRNGLHINIEGRDYTPLEAVKIADTIKALVYDLTEAPS